MALPHPKTVQEYHQGHLRKGGNHQQEEAQDQARI